MTKSTEIYVAKENIASELRA